MVKKEMIVAGISLYNSDIKLLKDNINHIIKQVDYVICVDNGSDNLQKIRQLLDDEYKLNNISLISNETNLGIAKALNQMFEFGESNGYDWILTLDQDTVCPDDLMDNYISYLNSAPENVAVISPYICDRNDLSVKWDVKQEIEEVNECITSASLNRISAWKRVNGFKEPLFIDYVDQDYCATVREAGMKVIRINSVRVSHEIGKGTVHYLLGRKVMALNHSPKRKYYMVRNGLFYVREHKSVISVKHEVEKILFIWVKVIFYENQKWEKTKAMLCGLKDVRKLQVEINEKK